MRHRLWASFLNVVFAVGLLLSPLAGITGFALPSCGPLPYDAGDGVYTISSVSDWQSFACWVNVGDPDIGSAEVVLTADLDLSSASNLVPVGTSTNPFTGVFSGQGFSVNGLTLTTLAYNGGDYDGFAVVAAGLFGNLVDAEIRDLTITAPSLTIDVSTDVGSTNFNRITMLGIVAGASESTRFDTVSVTDPTLTVSNQGEYIIDSIHVVKTGVITGFSRSSSFVDVTVDNMDVNLNFGYNGEGLMFIYGGGISGNLSNIEDQSVIVNDVLRGHVSGSIIMNPDNTSAAEIYLGGIAGKAGQTTVTETQVTDLSITASSTNTSYIGGMIGYVQNSYDPIQFESSSVEGSLSGYRSIGGFVGHAISANLSVVDSFAHVTITGDQHLGGFFGFGDFTYESIQTSFTLGSITGRHALGGFFGGGILATTFSDSFSRMDITFIDDDEAKAVGGLGGYIEHPGGLAFNRLYFAGTITGNKGSEDSIDPIFGYIDTGSMPDWIEAVSIPAQVGLYPPWDVFYDETLNPTTSMYGTPKATEELKLAVTLQEGIDSDPTLWFDLDNVWLLNDGINDGYPMLRAFVVRVEFEVGDGPAREDQYLMVGENVDLSDYAREGYLLKWYLDEALTLPFDPTDSIQEDTVLYAGWTQALPETGATGSVAIWLLGLGIIGVYFSRRKSNV